MMNWCMNSCIARAMKVYAVKLSDSGIKKRCTVLAALLHLEMSGLGAISKAQHEGVRTHSISYTQPSPLLTLVTTRLFYEINR